MEYLGTSILLDVGTSIVLSAMKHNNLRYTNMHFELKRISMCIQIIMVRPILWQIFSFLSRGAVFPYFRAAAVPICEEEII